MVPDWCGLCMNALTPTHRRAAPAPAPQKDMAERFVERYPHLFHLAHGDAWPGLQRHGLLTSEQLTDLFKVSGRTLSSLLSQRRAESIQIKHWRHGSAVLRDQKPVRMEALPTVLTDGMTPAEWLLLLNQHVFLFPTDATATAMYGTYRQEPLVVLTLSSESLLRAHPENIRLTAINTGYFMRRPARRGRETFQPIHSFDRPLSGVKEVAVQGGIPDLMDHLVKAERHWPDGALESLFSA